MVTKLAKNVPRYIGIRRKCDDARSERRHNHSGTPRYEVTPSCQGYPS